MDIVYPVRDGDHNPELRYSLRSLVNIPHDRVWIVGYKPEWVKNVSFIPGNTATTYQARVYQNIMKACANTEISNHALIFNDDFYITAPVESMPMLYRGSLVDHLATPRVSGKPDSWWSQSLKTTMVALQAHGHNNPASYELHVPIPVNRRKMLEVLAKFSHVTPDNPPQWRTLYGNMTHAPARRHPDVKEARSASLHEPYHSTHDKGFPVAEPALDRLFPEPCIYER